MELKKLFIALAIEEEEFRQWMRIDDILEHFVENINSVTIRHLKQLELTQDIPLSQQYNSGYRSYLTRILIGFRRRIRDFMVRNPTNEELAHRLSWEIERIVFGEDRNVVMSGELNALGVLQLARPDLLVTKTWEALIGDPLTCQMCIALHGTTIPINEPFLRHGQAITTSTGGHGTFTYVDRQQTIAHPFCRCRMRINIATR